MEYIRRYCGMVLTGAVRATDEVIKLCQYILDCFDNEDIYVREDKVAEYFGYQKYFLYKLLPWEEFLFVLHCCTYIRGTELPRWPNLFMLVGRGAGKNGYTSFEDFCLLSPSNPIRGYNIQSFAASEDNAKTSFMELHDDVLDRNEKKMSNFFRWTLEEIQCKKTKSMLTYHTARPQSKDGGRPGKINIDECHVMQNFDLIDVAQGGLGKRPDPRMLITSTDGYVRDGPLDYYKAKGRAILNGEIKDNGFLPYICYCTKAEMSDPDNWAKANPSIEEFKSLKAEMIMEYSDYVADPVQRRAFAVKRMNCTEDDIENALTSWENIQACCTGAMPEDIPEIKKIPCVIGFDYAQTNDFLSAVIVSRKDGILYVQQHTWICKKSNDLYRIKFPYEEAVERGEAIIIDKNEIPAELPVLWVKENTQGKRILAGAGDSYRFGYLRRHAEAILGMKAEKRMFSNHYGQDNGKIYLTRPSDLMQVSTDINSAFLQHRFHCGDSKIMRWYFGNVKKVQDGKGNISYEKIDPKSRKTDGAMALFHAMTVAERLEQFDKPRTAGSGILRVRTY